VTPRQTAMLVGLASVWGAAFLFIAIAVGDLGAVGLSVARVVMASLGLMVWAKATGRSFRGRASRRDYLLLGTINAAVPFALVAAAELTIPASLAAIVNATAPLFSALVAALWLGDRLDARRAAGLALGLAGVALVVGLAPVQGGVSTVLAVAAVLGAAASFGVGGHLVKLRFAGEGPLTLSICQPLAATVISVPFLAVVPPRHVPGWGTIAAILVLGVGCTGFAYLLYFQLIEELGATSALTVTYLVPVFGVLWATLFRGEHVTAGMVAGAAVVLAGVLLVTGTGSRAAAQVP
jgi:drug/metabolite transporter (DMT)-like permease